MSKQAKVDEIVWAYLNETPDGQLNKEFVESLAVKVESSFSYCANMAHRSKKSWQHKAPPKQPSSKKAAPPIVQPSIVFSAASGNKIMSLDEYCEHYGLPRADITSHKLITHTAVPYYNIQFREKKHAVVVDLIEFESIILGYTEPEKISVKPSGSAEFQRLVYTDTHIGMDPSGARTMFDQKWAAKEQDYAFDRIIKDTIQLGGKHLFVDDLGDFMDGWNETTVRGGHSLPQNMDNREAYRQGLNIKRRLLDSFAPHFETVTFNNVCNDNHSSDFVFTVNEAFRQIAEIQYPNVTVSNHERFMSHYFIGDKGIILCHGKDEADMKFGLKVKADEKVVIKIEEYIRIHDMQKMASSIEFSKGDSHQALLDMCSSDVFDYFNYPAISPSSNYVSVNFKKGRRGYFNFLYDAKSSIVSIKPTFL